MSTQGMAECAAQTQWLSQKDIPSPTAFPRFTQPLSPTKRSALVSERHLLRLALGSRYEYFVRYTGRFRDMDSGLCHLPLGNDLQTTSLPHHFAENNE